MARPLRIDVSDGWYHITARGQNRQRIYHEVRDYADFLKRLEGMSTRYGVQVHGYVMMPNHFHLLIRTPRANASAALQWLNNGYAMALNQRHRQCGHVFQGRFKGILVEETWILDLSLYIHFNPIAVKALGWGKADKKAEDLGVAVPSAKLVEARIETLRRFRWSSYGAYAGYRKAPDWLRTDEILGYVEKGTDGYRRLAESRLTEGVKEKVWTKLKWGAILGGERFIRQMRSRAKVQRETQGRAGLQRRVAWPEIVEAVETVKGEPWADFVDRYGDWGRNMAFWMARRHGGLTLNEIGQAVGDMDYSAVSEALRSFERKHMPTAKVKRAMKTVVTNLSLET